MLLRYYPERRLALLREYARWVCLARKAASLSWCWRHLPPRAGLLHGPLRLRPGPGLQRGRGRHLHFRGPAVRRPGQRRLPSPGRVAVHRYGQAHERVLRRACTQRLPGEHRRVRQHGRSDKCGRCRTLRCVSGAVVRRSATTPPVSVALDDRTGTSISRGYRQRDPLPTLRGIAPLRPPSPGGRTVNPTTRDLPSCLSRMCMRGRSIYPLGGSGRRSRTRGGTRWL